MFGVLFTTEDGQLFRIYQDLPSAQYAAQNGVCGMGWKATIFDYDKENDDFLEFYTVE